MKPTVATLTLASAAIAQSLDSLPDCAQNCLTEFTTGSQIGDCARFDAKCICSSHSFIDGIACCLAGVCDAGDQERAVEFARRFCSTQGVTDLPESVTCASASGTSTPTSVSTSTTPGVTATPNVASPAMGFGDALYGGLFAALAML